MHLLNNKGVNIFAGTSDSLELWGPEGSEVEGSRLLVRLDAQASQLVISHTGSAFLGVFREDKDKFAVESLYPPQGVLLSKEENLPMGETVTDVTVPIAEHDILFLVLPHTLSWSLKPIDLMGAIPGASTSSRRFSGAGPSRWPCSSPRRTPPSLWRASAAGKPRYLKFKKFGSCSQRRPQLQGHTLLPGFRC
jgi:hypothetical protein